MDCTSCYEVELAKCPDQIIVKANFPANYDIYWILKDSLGNKFQRRVTTNSQGFLIIDTSVLPAGLLNSYRGAFELQLRSGNNYLEPVVFVFGESQYQCVSIKFVDIDYVDDDESELNVIEFKTPVVAGNGDSSDSPIVVPFINQTTISYQHNLGRFVSVDAYKLNGNKIGANVDNTDANNVTVSLNAPDTGRLLIY